MIENHGWTPGYHEGGQKGLLESVSRTYAGVGTLGGLVVPDGSRRLYAGYSHDGARRRYIALTLGDDEFKEWDGRDQAPAEIALRVNAAAEKFADYCRTKNGLPALHSAAQQPEENPEPTNPNPRFPERLH